MKCLCGEHAATGAASLVRTSSERGPKQPSPTFPVPLNSSDVVPNAKNQAPLGPTSLRPRMPISLIICSTTGDPGSLCPSPAARTNTRPRVRQGMASTSQAHCHASCGVRTLAKRAGRLDGVVCAKTWHAVSTGSTCGITGPESHPPAHSPSEIFSEITR